MEVTEELERIIEKQFDSVHRAVIARVSNPRIRSVHYGTESGEDMGLSAWEIIFTFKNNDVDNHKCRIVNAALYGTDFKVELSEFNAKSVVFTVQGI
jgi:hypothetical protein